LNPQIHNALGATPMLLMIHAGYMNQRLNALLHKCKKPGSGELNFDDRTLGNVFTFQKYEDILDIE
jgi:hypothetical protein